MDRHESLYLDQGKPVSGVRSKSGSRAESLASYQSCKLRPIWVDIRCHVCGVRPVQQQQSWSSMGGSNSRPEALELSHYRFTISYRDVLITLNPDMQSVPKSSGTSRYMVNRLRYTAVQYQCFTSTYYYILYGF